MNHELADEDLMLRYGRGDANAFEVLYSRHKGGVLRYLLRQCRDHALAEELFQDIWMNVINARERYTVTAKFTTWLYRIAHNRLLDHRRRQGTSITGNPHNRVHETEELADPGALSPERGVEMHDLREKLLSLLEQLPDEQRQVFLLREEGGLTVNEIAATVGINPETAKSRLRYAVRKLRGGLGDQL